MSKKQVPVLPGMKVKCNVTGYVGIVDHVSEYWHSARRVAIQPPKDKSGKIVEAIAVDECQCTILDAKRIVEMDCEAPLYQFGQKAKDPVTGFEGTITGMAEYLNGCRRVCLEPALLKGEAQDPQWFNEARVKPIGKVLGQEEAPAPVRTGGPANSAMRRDHSFR